jgi:hypothetical protein
LFLAAPASAAPASAAPAPTPEALRLKEAEFKSAAADFHGAVHKVGVSLAMRRPEAARAEMQEVWSALTRLRDASSFGRLRSELLEIAQGFTMGEVVPHIAHIGTELDRLAETGTDVSAARRHLQAAHEAACEKKLGRLRESAASVLDSLIGNAAGFPLPEWTAGMRRVQDTLSRGLAGEKSQAEALEIIIGLEGADRFWGEVERDALRAAERLIAAATEMYADGWYAEAREQLKRAEYPLRVAGRAAGDEDLALKTSRLYSQLLEADRLMKSGNWWHHHGSVEGFRLLREARRELARMIERSKVRRPTPAAGSGSAGRSNS